MIQVEAEKFVINKDKKGEFKFDFIDRNGNIILSSGSYIQKTMCINGIVSVKRNSQDTSKYNLKRTSGNEPFFNLKSFNGRILGKSQIFEDKISRDSAIKSFISNAPNALIEDQSK